MLTLLATAVLLAPPAPVRIAEVSAEILAATRLDDPPGSPPRTHLPVRATGHVGSSGWGDAVLVARGAGDLIGPSKDGYLEFSLVARPPASGGYHLDVEVTVPAAMFGEIVVVPGRLKGVRVYGAGGNFAAAKIAGLEDAERRSPDRRTIEGPSQGPRPRSR